MIFIMVNNILPKFEMVREKFDCANAIWSLYGDNYRKRQPALYFFVVLFMEKWTNSSHANSFQLQLCRRPHFDWTSRQIVIHYHGVSLHVACSTAGVLFSIFYQYIFTKRQKRKVSFRKESYCPPYPWIALSIKGDSQIFISSPLMEMQRYSRSL